MRPQLRQLKCALHQLHRIHTGKLESQYFQMRQMCRAKRSMEPTGFLFWLIAHTRLAILIGLRSQKGESFSLGLTSFKAELGQLPLSQK